MKWYEDLLAWVAIILVSTIVAIGMYFVGKQDVVYSCKNYGAYVINKDEAILCVVKPLIKSNQGELNYLRPNGNKLIKIGETL